MSDKTDACSADAVQVLTGCTSGKGNFVYKDYGKMGLTLFSRKTGEGVRVAMRPGAFAPDEPHYALLQKVMKGEATEAESVQFRERHMQRSRDVLTMPEAELFSIRPVTEAIPAKAIIAPSEPCGRCGEPVMGTKLEKVDDQQICRGCLEQTK